MRNNLATIKIHPFNEGKKEQRRPSQRLVIPIIIAIIVGIVSSVILWQILSQTKYYISQVKIKVEPKNPSSGKSVTSLEYHLGKLITTERQFIAPSHGIMNLKDLIEARKVSVWIDKEEDSIIISASDESRRFALELAKLIAYEYVAELENKIRESIPENDPYETLLEKQRLIETKLEDISRLIETQTSYNSQTKQSYAEIFNKALEVSKEREKELKSLREKLIRLRETLTYPVVEVPEKFLKVAKEGDIVYKQDYLLLKIRHQKYIYYLNRQGQLVSETINKTLSEIRETSKYIASKLELELPAALVDNLLELHALIEIYEDKLSSFKDRWDKFIERISTALADPVSSDYSLPSSMINQLREYYTKQIEEFPLRLALIFKRFTNPKKEASPDIVESTIKDKISLELTDKIDRILEKSKLTSYYIKLSIPENNVNMAALSRSCKLLQNRLSIRERHLQKQLERKLLTQLKDDIRKEIINTQMQFEKKTEEIIKSYQELQSILEKISKTADNLIAAKDLIENLSDIKSKIAAIKSEEQERKFLLEERLRVSAANTKEANLIPFVAGKEKVIAIFFGLIIAILSTVYVGILSSLSKD